MKVEAELEENQPERAPNLEPRSFVRFSDEPVETELDDHRREEAKQLKKRSQE